MNVEAFPRLVQNTNQCTMDACDPQRPRTMGTFAARKIVPLDLTLPVVMVSHRD